MIDELMQQLRAADPAAELDRDPHGPTGRRLLAQARSRGEGATALRRPVRRGRVIVTVAGLMAVSGAGALAAGVFEPDPADVAAILDAAEPHREVHLDGWRPELTSEVIVCAYEGGAGALTSASEFPLDEPLTAAAITAECTHGNDTVRSGEAAAPEETTLCGGTLAVDDVERRLGSVDARVLAGSLDAERPRFPVVLGWHADCEEVQLTGGSPMELQPLDSLDRVNTARAVEVRLKAAALQRCLTHEQAEQLAEQGHRRLGPGWLLIDQSPPDATCHEVWVEAPEGWVTIVGLTGSPGAPAEVGG
jgi:hypothetical protein